MIRRHRELVDQLASLGDQADIDPLRTQSQSNMQHEHLLFQPPGRIDPAHGVP
jgi:hypothetical protein